MKYTVEIKPTALKDLTKIYKQDLLDLRKAKKKDAGKPTLSLSDVKKNLGI